jgi:hypothetical protein
VLALEEKGCVVGDVAALFGSLERTNKCLEDLLASIVVVDPVLFYRPVKMLAHRCAGL